MLFAIFVNHAGELDHLFLFNFLFSAQVLLLKQNIGMPNIKKVWYTWMCQLTIPVNTNYGDNVN